jgi:hypothetical protein
MATPEDTIAAIGYDPADPPMMRCGHAANATRDTVDGPKPCCAICAGIGGLGGDEVADERPSLEGRTMRCTYATGRDGKGHQPATVPSRWGAAFFEYRPDKATDRYYCGCWGWD